MRQVAQSGNGLTHGLGGAGSSPNPTNRNNGMTTTPIEHSPTPRTDLMFAAESAYGGNVYQFAQALETETIALATERDKLQADNDALKAALRELLLCNPYVSATIYGVAVKRAKLLIDQQEGQELCDKLNAQDLKRQAIIREKIAAEFKDQPPHNF